MPTALRLRHFVVWPQQVIICEDRGHPPTLLWPWVTETKLLDIGPADVQCGISPWSPNLLELQAESRMAEEGFVSICWYLTYYSEGISHHIEAWWNNYIITTSRISNEQTQSFPENYYPYHTPTCSTTGTATDAPGQCSRDKTIFCSKCHISIWTHYGSKWISCTSVWIQCWW